MVHLPTFTIFNYIVPRPKFLPRSKSTYLQWQTASCCLSFSDDEQHFSRLKSQWHPFALPVFQYNPCNGRNPVLDGQLMVNLLPVMEHGTYFFLLRTKNKTLEVKETTIQKNVY